VNSSIYTAATDNCHKLSIKNSFDNTFQLPEVEYIYGSVRAVLHKH